MLSLRSLQQIEVRLHSRYTYCSSGCLCKVQSCDCAACSSILNGKIHSEHNNQANQQFWDRSRGLLGPSPLQLSPLPEPCSTSVGATFGPAIRLLCISERLNVQREAVRACTSRKQLRGRPWWCAPQTCSETRCFRKKRDKCLRSQKPSIDKLNDLIQDVWKGAHLHAHPDN